MSDVIEPDLPILDPHHHLWAHAHESYLIGDFAADLASGHNVVATIYVECTAMYRKSGPEPMRTVGEAEFVAGQAAMSDSGGYGPTRICAGFVGSADFTIGERVDDVLEALQLASGGRLRGIRVAANWDADPSVRTGVRPFAPRQLLRDGRFRQGFKRLAARQLVYDAWVYHPQLDDVCDLADAFPDVTIVANHCGGLLGIGPYARRDNFDFWKGLVTELAKRPNVQMKLGGLSAKRCGFGFDGRTSPPTASDKAEAWRPYIQTCIDLFGPDRCMFESNFPPDRVAGGYRDLWNAMKIIAAPYSAAEKSKLFSGTASRVYNITI